ncbi:MAG: hypothetical protein IH993_08050, partial [Proteobacteria bacterium]|nr:hypothetical protein [Pseudomonadota bacterium]
EGAEGSLLFLAASRDTPHGFYVERRDDLLAAGIADQENAVMVAAGMAVCHIGIRALDPPCEVGSHGRPFTWSSTLLFADRKDGNQYRWYEVAFFSLVPTQKDTPFALEGYEADIDLALGNIGHSVNVAYGPYPIDGEDEESFINRWIGLVAKAATGELTSPNHLPIPNF